MKLKYILAIIFLLTATVVNFAIYSKPVLANNYGCNTNTNSDDYKRFPFGFFCPRNDGGNYSQVSLRDGPSTPGGNYSATNSDDNAESIAPGQVLNFTTGYNNEGEPATNTDPSTEAWPRTAPPNEGDSRPNGETQYYPDTDSDPNNNLVYVWTIIDGNDSVVDSVEDTGSTLKNGSAIPAFRTSIPCPTVDAYQGLRKPDSYNGGATTTGWAGNWGWSAEDPSRSPFAGGGLDGGVNCGASGQGKMILWRLSPSDARSQVDIDSFKFRLNMKDFSNVGDDKKVCLRTIVSVRMGGDEDPFNTDNLRFIAAKSKYRCYQINETTIQGTVRSSETNATGKLLNGVRVIYDRYCDGNEDKYVFTGQNGWPEGFYSFNAYVGEKYCVYVRGNSGAPPPYSTERQTVGATTYWNPVGLLRGTGLVKSEGIQKQVAGVSCDNNNSGQGSSPDGGSYFVNCTGTTQDIPWNFENEDSDPDKKNTRGNDFKYDPVPTSPSIEKFSFPDGTDENGNFLPPGNESLRPGDRVSFSISVKNGIDANQPVYIKDYIPLNMIPDMSDLDKLRVDCVIIDPFGDEAPTTWRVEDGTVPCKSEGDNLIPNASNYFDYGNDEPEIGYSLIGDLKYQKIAGSGSTRPYIGFDVSKMPAYSEITIEWSGVVKPADQIGVYPGYEAAAQAGDYRYCTAPNSGTYNNTSRLMSECEDISANGFQGVANYVETTASGAVSALSNITYNPIPGDITSFNKSVSGGTTFGGGEAYNIENPAYNYATFRSQVIPNLNLGPVRYTVIDQTNGSNNNYGSNPLDKAIATVDNILPSNPAPTRGAGNADSLGSITWPEQNSAQPGAQDTFSFYSTFDGDRPVGESAINNSKVCWREYWNNPHNEVCKNSSASILRVRMDEPNVAVDFGGVTGGGNITVRDNGTRCDVADASKGGVVGNPGSYGMYMLTVQNKTGYNSLLSKSGFGIQKTSEADGLSCRPDITKEARNYSNFTTLPSNTISGPNPATYQNKVVKASGDVFINNLTVNGRWTLLVEGRVYIKGNITKGGVGALAPGSSDSLGIIATDGIYISKDVSQVNALLYAGGYNNFSGTYSSGVIDTCADENNRLQAKTTTPGYTAANCRENNLTVNGIMYARTLKLNRTKVSVTDWADRVILTGQTYLMMPPAFNVLYNKGSSGSIREQIPRF